MDRPIPNRHLLVRWGDRDPFDSFATSLPVAPALWEYFRGGDASPHDDKPRLAATSASKLDSGGPLSASFLFPRAPGWDSPSVGLFGALRRLHPPLDAPTRTGRCRPLK